METTHNDMATRDLIAYLAQFKGSYPDIEAWAVKTLTSQTRKLLSISANGRVGGLAVLRPGPQVKLCHLSVAPRLQGRGFGSTLFDGAIGIARGMGSDTLRFSAPQSLLETYAQLFSSLGTKNRGLHHKQYRLEDPEMVCCIFLGRVLQ